MYRRITYFASVFFRVFLVEVLCIFRGKIYPSYRVLSNMAPCLGSFVKVKLLSTMR